MHMENSAIIFSLNNFQIPHDFSSNQRSGNKNASQVLIIWRFMWMETECNVDNDGRVYER